MNEIDYLWIAISGSYWDLLSKVKETRSEAERYWWRDCGVACEDGLYPFHRRNVDSLTTPRREALKCLVLDEDMGFSSRYIDFFSSRWWLSYSDGDWTSQTIISVCLNLWFTILSISGSPIINLIQFLAGISHYLIFILIACSDATFSSKENAAIASLNRRTDLEESVCFSRLFFFWDINNSNINSRNLNTDSIDSAINWPCFREVKVL